MKIIKESTKKIFEDLFLEYKILEQVKSEIIDVYNILIECYGNGGKVLICGNGGSASDSEHIVGELMKGFRLKRPINSKLKEKINEITEKTGSKNLAEVLQSPLRAISLVSQTSLITAAANDIGADYIFAQQILGYAERGDVLIALSTSGNALNIINAAAAARALECKVAAVTGGEGGSLKNICDYIIKLPADETYRVQELTLPVYHALCAAVENEFFEK